MIKRYLNAFLLKKYDHKWSSAPAPSQSMTLVKVANDLHIGSRYQDNPSALKELRALEPNHNAILNGDIFDLSCCPPKDVRALRRMQIDFIHIYRNKFRFGNHCLPGSFTSEELKQIECFGETLESLRKPYIVETKTGKLFGFEHGHLFGNRKNKWAEYEKKKPGAGKLKLLATSLLDNLDHLKAGRPLPENFIEDAAQWCIDTDVDGVVCGHFHVEAERRYLHRNKIIIVLPAHKINYLYLP